MPRFSCRQAIVTAIMLASATLLSCQAANAQEATRITAPQLFPEKTLAYVRVDDVAKLREDLARSSIGKLGKDPNLEPIFSEFYGSLVNSTANMQEAIGLNLDELLSIPRGEFALALLPSDQSSGRVERNGKEGRESVSVQLNAPALAMLLDAGDEISSVQVMLKRIEESLPADMEQSEKNVDSLTLHRYQNVNRQDQRFAYFIDKGVMIACSDPDYLEQLASVWLGTAGEWSSLADNRRFTSILSRCVGTQGERPQVSFYVDPLAIVRQFSPKTATSTAVIAMLPAFGLDGIQALGGSWIVAPPDFDSIAHFHALLSSPRRSILGLLRPKSGSTSPEKWVPDTIASYSTLNWDTASTLTAVEQLYNQFRGEDALNTEVFARVNGQLKIDLRKDVIENLEGRLTMLQGFVRPVTINSGSNVYAIRMKNIDYIKNNVLPKVLEVVAGRSEVTEERIGKLTFSSFKPGRGANPQADRPIRQPEICVGTIDDYLVFADSRYMMQQVADCLNGNASRLLDALEFQLISDRIAAQLQNKECSAISYSRPEESLQLFYELARDPKNRERLRQVADSNGFFKALLAALEKRELPPFSVISKYLAPGGGFLLDEETGLHYMSFSLRRE